MEVGIVRINKANYYLLDELIFYRINGRHRNEEENMQPLIFLVWVHAFMRVQE